MLTLKDITKMYKQSNKADRKEFFDAIIDDLFTFPAFEERLGIRIEDALLTSELKPIKRIADLENITGLNDFSDFEDEDREPTLPERISLLEEKLPELQGSPVKLSDNTPTCKTEIRAFKLVERLKKARENAGNKFLSSAEIIGFLKSGIDDALRVKEGQNVRQIKKEVLEKAARMFPEVFVSQKTTGRKDLRLVLKT